MMSLLDYGQCLLLWHTHIHKSTNMDVNQRVEAWQRTSPSCPLQQIDNIHGRVGQVCASPHPQWHRHTLSLSLPIYSARGTPELRREATQSSRGRLESPDFPWVFNSWLSYASPVRSTPYVNAYYQLDGVTPNACAYQAILLIFTCSYLRTVRGSELRPCSVCHDELFVHNDLRCAFFSLSLISIFQLRNRSTYSLV